MFRTHLWIVLSLILPITVSFSGCGDGKVSVSGSISYEGQIPEEGTIAFITDNGAGVTYGEPYFDGKYSARIPEGKYVVRITGIRVVTLAEPIPGVFGGPPTTTRDEQIIPDAYGLPSRLQVEVTRSARKHDFELKEPANTK